MLRGLALALAALTVALIAVGGLVTNTDSGLACPDWPMCFGTPFPRMVGGVLMEHGHRYLATFVGALATLLAVGTLRRGRQGLVALPLLGCSGLLLGAAFRAGAVQYRTGALPAPWAALALLGFAGCLFALGRARGEGRLASLALLLVIAQGLLGGLTVIYRLPVTVLVLHLATSMLFLGTAVLLAVRLGAPAPQLGARGRGLLLAATAALYAQIVLGAAVRHTGAGLVCTDLPLCRGALWPLGVHPAVHLHMAHRALALVAAALLIAAGARCARSTRGAARALALALPALVLAQLALGVLTIATFKDLVPVTAHLLVAALLLADCVGLFSLAFPRAWQGPLGEAPAAPSRARAA